APPCRSTTTFAVLHRDVGRVELLLADDLDQLARHQVVSAAGAECDCPVEVLGRVVLGGSAGAPRAAAGRQDPSGDGDQHGENACRPTLQTHGVLLIEWWGGGTRNRSRRRRAALSRRTCATPAERRACRRG